MDHWNILHNRMVSAARRMESCDDWTTEVLKSLGVAAPSSLLSGSLRALTDYVRENDCVDDLFHTVQKETALVMSLARKAVEEAQAKASEAQATDGGETKPRRSKRA